MKVIHCNVRKKRKVFIRLEKLRQTVQSVRYWCVRKQIVALYIFGPLLIKYFVFFKRALASQSCSCGFRLLVLFWYKYLKRARNLVTTSKLCSLAFHTISLSALRGCSLRILTYFIKLSPELTVHLLIMLEGLLSTSLYKLYSVNLLTRFAF